MGDTSEPAPAVNPHAPAKVAVTTTMRPDDPIQVTEAERKVLRQHGLLIEAGDTELTKACTQATAKLGELAGGSALGLPPGQQGSPEPNEHPGSGVPMTGTDHPAGGTTSPPVSNPADPAPPAKKAAAKTEGTPKP